jgi:hypothetical protein
MVWLLNSGTGELGWIVDNPFQSLCAGVMVGFEVAELRTDGQTDCFAAAGIPLATSGSCKASLAIPNSFRGKGTQQPSDHLSFSAASSARPLEHRVCHGAAK